MNESMGCCSLQLDLSLYFSYGICLIKFLFCLWWLMDPNARDLLVNRSNVVSDICFMLQCCIDYRLDVVYKTKFLRNRQNCVLLRLCFVFPSVGGVWKKGFEYDQRSKLSIQRNEKTWKTLCSMYLKGWWYPHTFFCFPHTPS